MNLAEIISAKNEMAISGLLLDAAEKYFAPTIRTIDLDGMATMRKYETMHKIKHFFGSIQKINEIILYRIASSNDLTFSEFTFDFERTLSFLATKPIQLNLSVEKIPHGVYVACSKRQTDPEK